MSDRRNTTKKKNTEIVRTMATMFYEYCDEPITTITDKLLLIMVNAFECDLDYMDTHASVKDAYQTLAYHHCIYKAGKSRKAWFRQICSDMMKGNYT